MPRYQSRYNGFFQLEYQAVYLCLIPGRATLFDFGYNLTLSNRLKYLVFYIRLGEDFNNLPSLSLADGTAFQNPHLIPYLAFALGIMSHIFRTCPDKLVICTMSCQPFYQYQDGLLHLVANDGPCKAFS
jgi:hypothetical protein